MACFLEGLAIKIMYNLMPINIVQPDSDFRHMGFWKAHLNRPFCFRE